MCCYQDGLVECMTFPVRRRGDLLHGYGLRSRLIEVFQTLQLRTTEFVVRSKHFNQMEQ